ncbi:hypothetical protein DRW71_15095 [Salmonella enterica subsp. diarizonae]|uniref:Transposase n=3 Tax=Salmonella enterica TaxID=28901 RepID=A0A5U3D7Y1_SALDZ|nr:hypothetical protein DOE63_28760 [Salmonella enterica subsp. diarizonae serovar 59:z10:-]EAA7554614.1 hypothetical protein [Salmonella enterica]EAA7931525.1 hypothetical protein [Salmonella enterica subsp. enterica serovar Redlands]EAB9741398.1 hypothetical protein [Salmonella enterica subsp. diarizonae]EAS9238558.1 hypothetical protein [Salmonella enterica subsp. enterica]EBE3721906.1 hypothetical protein [Salmonella enterica subsp. diarizonae serovar 42:l,v:1,5,7]EBV2373727.1 hypothetica
MDEKQLQALANELAKNLKTPDDLSQFDRLLKKISVEAALNAEMSHHLGYDKNQSKLGANSRNGYSTKTVTSGDNPQQLHSEAGFAALCGVSPVPASSGKKNRHRLNRGGDRAANSALHIIAIGRLRTDTKTQEYVAKRVAEGHSKMEALRCLKRYISREVYTLLRNQNRQINSTQITT